MIYILHGENIVASRNFILDLKKSQNAILAEFKSADCTQSQILSTYFTSDLFGQKVIVVLDITSDKSFDFESLLDALKKSKSSNDLVFFSSKALGKTHALIKASAAKSDQKFTIKEFKEEFKPSVFNFLDALFEKRKTDAYKEFESLVSSGTDEFEIFSMVFFGIRNLSLALFDSKALTKLHPFVKGKVVYQAKKYNQKKVIEIYKFLYEHDLNAKTGKGFLDVTIPLLIEKVAL